MWVLYNFPDFRKGSLSLTVPTREQTHQPPSEEVARALRGVRSGHGSDLVALHERVVNFQALAPSTSFGNLTPALHKTGEAVPVVGHDQLLASEKQRAQLCRKERHALWFGKERVTDSRRGDKDQLPWLGVMTPTKLQ